MDLTLRVLILHLKRYGYDNFTEEQEKKQDKVNIERFIALGRYLCNVLFLNTLKSVNFLSVPQHFHCCLTTIDNADLSK